MRERRTRGSKAQRIITFEEFMATPRTPAEIESYHGCLAALQRMGMVDEQLNVLGPPGRLSQ